MLISRKNHPRGESGADLVYPVFSRRSNGLSVGINLFPAKKNCNFDCPYCEVHPFQNKATFSLERLEDDLIDFFENHQALRHDSLPVRDICISGNGEPTLSPFFAEALAVCAKIRSMFPETAGKADFVLITNGTGFMNEVVATMLHEAVAKDKLQIWAKLDAGSQELFAAMSRSKFMVEEIIRGMTAFARQSPLIIQTMLCRLKERQPTHEDARQYAQTINAMIQDGARIQAIQFYTVARMPFELYVSSLSRQQLLEYVEFLLPLLILSIPFHLYDESGEIPMDAS